MKTGNYTKREFQKILKKNCFYFLRNGKGDHKIYSNGRDIMSVTFPMKKTTTLKLIREYHLKVD